MTDGPISDTASGGGAASFSWGAMCSRELASSAVLCSVFDPFILVCRDYEFSIFSVKCSAWLSKASDKVFMLKG